MTAQLNAADPDAPLASRAVTVTAKLPGSAGMPEITPVAPGSFPTSSPGGKPSAVKVSACPVPVSLALTGTRTAVPVTEAWFPGLITRTVSRTENWAYALRPECRPTAVKLTVPGFGALAGTWAATPAKAPPLVALASA